MSYRLARSLVRMREQFNHHSSQRNKASDGWIGDARHAASTSDHNPWVRDGALGVVTALDITHDPKNRVDTYAIAEHMRTQKDPRVKYVISNKRIFSSTTAPWTWRNYTGSNPHSSHFHVSVNSSKHHYDDERDWNLFSNLTPSTQAPASNVKPVLKLGSVHEEVKTIQRLLALALVDGKFGPITDAAVRAFQKKEKLLVDGVVGPKTWAELDKIEQLPLPLDYAEPRILSEPEGD